jgi:hypothetical protein
MGRFLVVAPWPACGQVDRRAGWRFVGDLAQVLGNTVAMDTQAKLANWRHLRLTSVPILPPERGVDPA